MDVRIEKLKKGMIIDSDVIGLNGSLLLYRGYAIENIRVLRKLLENHGIHSVEIREEESEKTGNIEITKETSIELKIEMEVASFKESFNEVVDSLKNEYESIIKGEEVSREELEKTASIAWEYDERVLTILQLISKIREDNFTIYAHSANIALISYVIGKWMHMEIDELKELTLSAILADIGRYKVLQELIETVGTSDSDESNLMKKYPRYSYELIKEIEFLDDNIKLSVLHQHERYDGSGYPGELKGDEIPLFARIIAIASVYDALTSTKSYRTKKTPFEAIKVMETEYMDKLDIKILYTFLHRIGSCFIGSIVEFSDGRKGEVVFVPEEGIYKPYVKMHDSGEVINLNNNEYRHMEIIDVR